MGPYTELYLNTGSLFARPIRVGDRVFHAKRELHGIVTDRTASPGVEPNGVIFTYYVTLTNGEVVPSCHLQLMPAQVGLLDFLAEAAA